MPLQRPGRVWTWKDSPTAADAEYALTTASLADDAKRQGVKVSLADAKGRFADLFTFEIDVNPTSSPSAATIVSLYWGGSPSSTAATNNPGGMSGADAAWALGEDLLDDLWFIGNYKAAAEDANRTASFSSSIPFANGMPLIWNQLGVALDDAVVRITELIG